jgi:ABC-type amino acid transport substrate-binding protein
MGPSARALLPALLALGAAACGGEGDATRIRVATEAAYPPFESKRDDGTIEGFDIDIVRAAARESGLEAEFVDQVFDGILPGLAQGRYDAAVSSITITEERAREVDFTDPYFEAGRWWRSAPATRRSGDSRTSPGRPSPCSGTRRATARPRRCRGRR